MTSIYGDNDGHEDSDLMDEFGVCETCGDEDELKGGMCEGCWDETDIDVVDSDELEEDEDGWADLDDEEDE